MTHICRASVLTIGAHYPELDRVLAGLAAQNLPLDQFEVILTDTQEGRWERAAREARRQYPALDLTYLRVDADRLWRARLNNAAIRRSRGAVLVFLAGDFIPAPGLLSAHLAFHERHPEREAIGIGYGVFPPDQISEPLPRWLEGSGTLFGTKLDEHHEVPPQFFYVANSSVKRELMEQAGPFDEDFQHDTWDDYEMGIRMLRAGARSYLVREAIARHEHDHPVTLAERRVMMRRSGEAALLFERKHPGPYPWTSKVALPAWRYSLAAARARVRYAASRAPADLDRYFQNVMDAEFVAGYGRPR